MTPHDHSHAQGHHAHGPASGNYTRAFVIGVGLNTAFIVVEVIYGWLTNSLALLADAGHNVSDVLGLLLVWGAHYLSQRPATPRYTYGLRRTSILAALINAVVLMLAMGAIAWEAIQRVQSPNPVPGLTIIIVAGIGVVINTVSALMFLSGRDRDLNLKGAFMHLAADALVSLGVVLAGLVILTVGWYWIDPVMSLVIVAVIVSGTWQLLWDALKLALDAVPNSIEPQAVRLYLSELAGVTTIHDLHIWAMSTTETALTAHLVMPNGHPGDTFLTQTHAELQHHFGIHHVTLQIETDGTHHSCAQESCV